MGNITINGRSLAFRDGATILEVARENNIEIPTLCALKGASPTRRCGVCVVEAQGADDLMRACGTVAREGLVVRTESPKVVASRKTTIEAFLASGFHNCAVCGSDEGAWPGFQAGVQESDGARDLCPVWGDCQLQDLAYKYQVRAGTFERPAREFPKETVNPFIYRDFSRCIRCSRCEKACNEVQVNQAIAPLSADPAGTDFPLATQDCVYCGECVQACPVGALVEKDVRYRVRPWETKKIRSTCSYCGVGCQIWLHVKDDKVVKVTGVEDVGPNWGSLCVKGRFGFDFVNHPDRLKTPLIREGEEFREATWDEALDYVAGKLKKIKEEKGPQAFGMLTSARITNEENYLSQKFTRAVMKTNNVDHCARL